MPPTAVFVLRGGDGREAVSALESALSAARPWQNPVAVPPWSARQAHHLMVTAAAVEPDPLLAVFHARGIARQAIRVNSGSCQSRCHAPSGLKIGLLLIRFVIKSTGRAVR